MSLLRDRAFRAAAFAHWAVDVMNSQYPLLLAALSGPLGLSYTIVGILSAIYSLSGSLSQPIFGHWADRMGHRRIAAGGLLVMLFSFAAALLLEGMATLGILILMAVGSAAFHPAAAAEAARRGRVHLDRQENTAASIFFLFGQGGLFLGPLFGGALLDWGGSRALLLLLLLLIPVGWLLLGGGHRSVPNASPTPQVASPEPKRLAVPLMVLLLFTSLVAARSWVQTSMTAFLPKYLGDLGFRPSLYGGVTSLFMGASAIAGVLGGMLADRYGKRSVVSLSLMLAAPPLALIPNYQSAGMITLLSFWAGGALGVSYSILVVLGQNMFPRREGMASGLVLGFTFASGSIGALFSGMLVDLAGFQAFYGALAGLAVLAGLLGLGLRNLEGQARFAPEHTVH
ncbi:MAG TPA: MFS transporter [Chloroflexi bacterium]|nr:MFS transporter [Chloroflexota bacterium]